MEGGMDRALLVGINTYPGAPLAGCVNDVVDMADFLVKSCAVKESAIRLLVDGRATTQAILERLKWLVGGAKAGDRLLFHYSGHGAQVATRAGSGEVDGLDEVICPVDFDWSDAHLIRDKDFFKLFAKVPTGVHFVWISDSCHSGDLSKDMVRIRAYPHPADVLWRNRVARGLEVPAGGLVQTARKLNQVALISGCRSDQTSSDAVFGGRPNGALTYYLLGELKRRGGLVKPLSKLMPGLHKALHAAHYDQNPQLEGPLELRNAPFM
jgi:metacaspase-1